MIRLKDVTVYYPNNEKPALSSVNLTFNKGEFVCVLGKSGAGKSTLIRCMNGLQQPTSGEVFWDGELFTNKNKEQQRLIRREIGMIFQHFNLIPRLTVLQNVLTGMFGYRNSVKNLLGIFSEEEIQKATQVLEVVGLLEFKNRRIEYLSGGQKQRVGIARALLQKPRVFLGDEPVASLDPGTANRIFTLLKELHNRHNLLSVVNLHDVNLAKQFATRLIALRNGTVIFDGKPEDFAQEMFEQTYNS
ncbi:phosphonate ABC transporter ATP-binding protein [Fredinandcohnia sp. QZ13]|uniref:phosphonate ABC transporter ATP-binding protein n=1 Tax=Fredinandcohnia sp. QZ13 TaxID=3073144 RepID=UPI00285324A2|nr:phosphonate ABC transporter ATP-binding protein [Fredinandcohnia sp. QZ13]MDR4886249.1 phosphonate ABC transporter ATP-binding protein [Fredinandcohnia sp. QZ13]